MKPRNVKREKYWRDGSTFWKMNRAGKMFVASGFVGEWVPAESSPENLRTCGVRRYPADTAKRLIAAAKKKGQQ